MWVAKDREKAGVTPSFWLARGCLLNEGSSNPTAEASLTDGPAPRTGRFLDLHAGAGWKGGGDHEQRASVQEERLALV